MRFPLSRGEIFFFLRFSLTLQKPEIQTWAFLCGGAGRVVDMAMEFKLIGNMLSNSDQLADRLFIRAHVRSPPGSSRDILSPNSRGRETSRDWTPALTEDENTIMLLAVTRFPP